MCIHTFLCFTATELSPQMVSITVGVSIAVALLVGAICLVVGVVTGIYSTKRLQLKDSANAQPSKDQPVTEAAFPEYEEINLEGTKHADNYSAHGKCSIWTVLATTYMLQKFTTQNIL